MSFVGLVGETIVSACIDGQWESRAGFIVGPFSPLYGLGTVLEVTGAGGQQKVRIRFDDGAEKVFSVNSAPIMRVER